MIRDRETLLSYFQTGDRPVEAQFADLIHSVRHLTEDPITWSEITGKPSSFPAAWADITGKPGTFAPSAHTHPWSEVTGKPSFSTVATTGSYSDLSGIPSTFAPGPHSHSAGEISTGTFHPARLAAGTTTDGKIIQILSGVPTWVDAPSGGGSGWALTGNAGTAGTEILGTSDNKRVRIAANGQTKLWINPGTSGGTGVPVLGSFGNAAMAVMSGTTDMFGTVFGTDNSSGAGYIQAQRIDGVAASAFNLFLQPSGGNLGIGNTNPSFKLDVTGSARLSSVPTITSGTSVMVVNPSTGEISQQSRVQWGPSANASGGGISLGENSRATGFLGVSAGAYMVNDAFQGIGVGRGELYSTATNGILISGWGGSVKNARGIGIGFGVNVQHDGAFLMWDQGDGSAFFNSDAANQFKTQFRGGYKFQTGTTGSPVTQFEILTSGMLAAYNIPVYADKTAANTGLGRANVIFQTPTGMLGLS